MNHIFSIKVDVEFQILHPQVRSLATALPTYAPKILANAKCSLHPTVLLDLQQIADGKIKKLQLCNCEYFAVICNI